MTVFLFIPQSVFISDLLRTRYIEYLAEKHRVIVFTPSIDQETARTENYYLHPNIEYIKWDHPDKKTLNRFKYLRPLLIRKFDHLITVRQTEGRETLAMSRSTRLVRWLSKPFSKILTTDFFTRLELFLIKTPPAMDEYIRRYQPSLIITATPGFNYYDGGAVLLAKKYKIPTVATNFTWDNLTSEAHMIRKTDFLFVWNDVVRKDAIELHHYPDEKVYTTGIMRFDHYFQNEENPKTREDFLASKGLDPNLKTILYATVSPAFIYHQKHLGYLVELREKKLIPYTNLLIRAHPFDRLEDYQKYEGLKNVCVEKAGQEVNWPDGTLKVEMNRDDLINLKNTLRYTDLNVNFQSTISLEASIFDKPIINFVESGKEYTYRLSHYKPIVDMGAVTLVRNSEELKNSIIEYLKNPKLHSAERKALVEKYIPFRDGLAYKRAVDFIEKII